MTRCFLAQAAVCGGALHVSQTALVTVTDSRFLENCACASEAGAAKQPGLSPGGGGVSAVESTSFFERCAFTGNRATLIGGGGLFAKYALLDFASLTGRSRSSLSRRRSVLSDLE